MTENNHGWVWTALGELIGLTAQHDEAVTEAERLAGCVTSEMDRIQAATGLSRQRLDEMVEGMRVIGPPPAPPPVPAAESVVPDADADPLAIPEYLRRGDGSTQEGEARAGTRPEGV